MKGNIVNLVGSPVFWTCVIVLFFLLWVEIIKYWESKQIFCEIKMTELTVELILKNNRWLQNMVFDVKNFQNAMCKQEVAIKPIKTETETIIMLGLISHNNRP